MDIINSLVTSVFGVSVVFSVLVSLIFLIYLQTAILKLFHREAKAETVTAPAPAAPAPTVPEKAPAVPGKLELVGIDEKTAAMVMAIICDESEIPANELIFKSIREIT